MRRDAAADTVWSSRGLPSAGQPRVAR